MNLFYTHSAMDKAFALKNTLYGSSFLSSLTPALSRAFDTVLLRLVEKPIAILDWC